MTTNNGQKAGLWNRFSNLFNNDITDMAGTPLQMASTVNLVVSNGHIHDEMLGVLAEVADPDR